MWSWRAIAAVFSSRMLLWNAVANYRPTFKDAEHLDEFDEAKRVLSVLLDE